MRSWQYSDLDVDRANRFTITSVDSRLTGDNTVTNGALFKFIQRALNVVGAPLRIVARGQGRNRCVLGRAYGCLALLLVGRLVGR